MDYRKEYERIKNSLHCNVTDDDYRQLDGKISDIKNLAKIENRAISLYDINRKKFLLKVDRHAELLGYKDTGKTGIDNVDRYHMMLHPDDLDCLYDSEIRMYNFLRPLSGNEKKDYKLVYDYRVKSKSGRYIRFLHQLSLFELDRNFNSWIMMIISDVISMYPSDEKPRHFLINMKTGKISLFNGETGTRPYLLTKREKEIMELVSQGLDSSRIAEKLCISICTVNNHRQHVLQKTSTRNMTQAVAYLKCIGML